MPRATRNATTPPRAANPGRGRGGRGQPPAQRRQPGTAGRETVQQLLNAGVADSTYNAEWKKYKKWIDDNSEDPEILWDFPNVGSGDDEGVRCYITRDNLDAYFTFAVVHREGSRDTIKRIGHALKYYALYKEHNLTLPNVCGDKFESETMRAAMAAQQVKEKRRGAIGSQIDDKCPHRFCKHTLSIAERIKVVTVAMKSRGWQNAIVAINLGHNVALRAASTRSLTLCDLILATGYGPGSHKIPCDPRFDRTLNLILRKGVVHKDRFKTTKQVGMWRHRDWHLDPNFSIGLSLIYGLRKEGDSIDFKNRPTGSGTKRPLWWDRPLIEWTDGKGK